MKKGKTKTKPKKESVTRPLSKFKVNKAKLAIIESKTPKTEKKATKLVKKEEKKPLESPSASEEVKQLLKLRDEVRQNRPKFLRQESWRYIRVRNPWRRPKGTDSRMRLRKKGWPSLVKIGYGGPAKARGLHPSGFKDILVFTKEELEILNPEIDAVRLSAGLGARKRREIVDRANELGLKILNLRGLTVLSSKE